MRFYCWSRFKALKRSIPRAVVFFVLANLECIQNARLLRVLQAIYPFQIYQYTSIHSELLVLYLCEDAYRYVFLGESVRHPVQMLACEQS